ncbi:MAG TPA: ribose-5-phosphate isomerase RpiA [Puia sp.]|nr:ribose-5-phosphate isomerase RpiA [Puia sp.]
MLPQDELKQRAGVYAADFVTGGAPIGLGTGSTVSWLIDELARRVSQGLQLEIVPTSAQTAALAAAAGITVRSLDEIDRLSLTIDGADEIDPAGALIKGGGGALLQEKIVASASGELIIIADGSKLVKQLGKFPLPVEVITFGWHQTRDRILDTGFCVEARLRQKEGRNFVTDHGHFILDCYCGAIQDPSRVNTVMHLIPGVVETGLFINMATRAIIGYPDGKIEEIEFRKEQVVIR